MWEERERDWETVRENKSLFSEEGHAGLSKHMFTSVWPQFLKMFADILNTSLHSMFLCLTKNCAFIKTNRSAYNLQFYCITEEVMLAEENKNSGRSPLDGKFPLF